MRRHAGGAGVAPGFLSLRKQKPGSSRVTARTIARWGCLQWLDVDGLKGSDEKLPGSRRVGARLSEPGSAAETRTATSGAPGGATLFPRLSGAPLPHSGSKKRRRRPSAELTPGADESRLYEPTHCHAG